MDLRTDHRPVKRSELLTRSNETIFLVYIFQVLNLFVALLVNAFDFREVDNDSNEEIQAEGNSSRCSMKKVFHTRKSRLFVAKYREPFRLYELQVLESSHCPMKENRQLAISDSEHHHVEPTDATCKGNMFVGLVLIEYRKII